MLIGEEKLDKLKAAKIAVFGLGGVGSSACAALARAGVGKLLIVDFDTVSESNINRQLIADYNTLGRSKADVMEELIHAVSPDTVTEKRKIFYDESTAGDIDLAKYDCVLDAIDSVPSKELLIVNAYRAGVKTVSCMGAGNKLDPTRFEAADIYETSVCPLARVMRQRLRKQGVEHLRVIYSKEQPTVPPEGGASPGSAPWCAPAAGLAAAWEAVRMILEDEQVF